MAAVIWTRITAWWSLAAPAAWSVDQISNWAFNSGLSPKISDLFDVVIRTALWIVWKIRNRACFDNVNTKPDQLFDDNCCSHFIEGDGTFNATGLNDFIKDVKLGECGLSYAVVAIMGPQSSGKSTLLNHLFHTNFLEMDAYRGRSQTTKGIWIARCVGIEPCTLVMDLEGTDGSERGEDDITFEKQSALFALAVSDIVLINMWCHDIGREHAANKPLLNTVFQVMLRLFSPRKITLMFVIRDKTRTPLENLEFNLRTDIQKIWASIPKPDAHEHTPLSDFFNVQVVALSNYEAQEEQFKEEVASLRQKFFQSIAPGGVAGDRRGVVPASGFSFSAQQIWKVIKENKDLDLPAHKVMVATIRCEEIANEKFSSFIANEEWLVIEEAVQSNLVPGFGNKLSSLLHNCLSSYDEEATYFEDSVRSAKKKQLEKKLIQLLQPAYQLMLEHIRSGTMDNFKRAFIDALAEGQKFAVAARECSQRFMILFDEQCQDAMINQANLDSAIVRDEFSNDLHSYTASVLTAKLSELTTLHEENLKKALYSPVEMLLKEGNDDTWPAIRVLLHSETARAVSEFSFSLSCFEMGEQKDKFMISKLKSYAIGVVKEKTREEARIVYHLMKERFTNKISHSNNSPPRTWTGGVDRQAIIRNARSSSLKLLSVLAAIRLDEETDSIWNALVSVLGDNNTTSELLASRRWEGVPTTMTIITPLRCRSMWNQFLGGTVGLTTMFLKEANTLDEQLCFVIYATTCAAVGTVLFGSSFVMSTSVSVLGGIVSYYVKGMVQGCWKY